MDQIKEQEKDRWLIMDDVFVEDLLRSYANYSVALNIGIGDALTFPELNNREIKGAD